MSTIASGHSGNDPTWKFATTLTCNQAKSELLLDVATSAYWRRGRYQYGASAQMAHNAHPAPTRLGAITDDPVAVAEECRLPGAVDGGGEQNAFSRIDASAERYSAVRFSIHGMQRKNRGIY